jgi:hypothetical protein
VTVPASMLTDVERTTFANVDMVRATIKGRGPDDHNRHVLYPLSYAVVSS